ncbi:MAG: MFS transporter [Nitrososphaeraceae archaeon]
MQTLYTVIMMDDLKKDEHGVENIDAETPKEQQQRSSRFQSKPVLPEGHKKIISSAWITLAILGSTILITMYGETMLLPAIRDIITDFDISYSTSSWILTAYLIAGAVATPIAGKLSDIYGRKKIVLIILIIYILGISAGGFSTNISFLLVARVIQGIGISMFPIAFGIIRDQLAKDKLAIGIGVFSSMFAAGSVVGLAVGGSIIQSFGWHATFLSIVPVAIALWIIINRSIHGDNNERLIGIAEKQGNSVEESDANSRSSNVDSPKPDRVGDNSSSDRRRPSLDIKGTIALAVTIASFLLTLTYIGSTSASSSSNDSVYHIHITVISLGLLSIGSLILFVLIERRASSPLIELSLITHKILLPANIIILIFGMTMFMVYQTIPILVRSPHPLGFGGDAIASAMIQLPFMIIFLIFAPSSGFIVSKIGNLKPTVVGTIIMTIGFFSLFIFHSTESMVAINLAIVASGISLIQVGAFNITMEYTPMQFSGVSLGMSVVLVLIGSSIGPAIAAIYMQTYQQEVAKGVSNTGTFFPSPISYNMIFLTAALVSTISIALVIVLRRRMILTMMTTKPQSN